MKQTHPHHPTVELWLRSFEPTTAGPTQRRALDRVTALEGTSAVETVEVGIWGSEIEATDRSSHSPRIPQLERIESRLETFEGWASRSGRQLEPFFRQRRVESSITGDCRDVWRLPTVALAEFVDGDLVHVAPCRDGERTVDVFDRLETLADEADEVRTETDATDADEDATVTFDGTHRNRNREEISDQQPDRSDDRPRRLGSFSPGSD